MSEGSFAFFRFAGDRYQRGADGMPIEALAELVTYRELVVEVSRSLWKRANPDRVRAPKNWDEKLDLRLTGFGDGSIVPVLERHEEAALGEFDDYFDQGRDYVTEAVQDVASGQGLPNDFPPSCVPKLSRLGRTLASGDRMFFGHPTDDARRTALTHATAARLRQVAEALSTERPESTLQGRIVEMDAEAETFELRTADNRRVPGRYATADADDVHNWLVLDENEGETVEATGLALVDADGVVQRFVAREPVTLRRVPVDGIIAVFLAASVLPDTVPQASLEILNRRSRALAEHFPAVGIAEHSDGILRIEWTDGTKECSAELEPDGTMFLHEYDTVTEEDEEFEGLTDSAGLERLDAFLAGGPL